jgi:glycosyltransferase involved in cell wall biosynthesis
MLGISVVIPTKDRLTFLQRAVPMFLEYDQVQEVIIVIDGCSDGTLEYVKAAERMDSRIKYTDNVVNMGLPYSRNRGIDLAQYDYVFTGEDDLELSADFFATLLSHMQETGADVISGRNIFRFESESAAEAVRRTDAIRGATVDRHVIAVQTGMRVCEDQEQILLPAPMLGNTAIFRKIRFDESYLVNAWREESDFQLAARGFGYKLVFCPHAISFNVIIRNDRGGVHYSGKVKRVIWIVKNNWRFIRKHHKLIADEFDIGNQYVYIVNFAAKRIGCEIVLPILINVKQKVFRKFGLHYGFEDSN